MLLPKAIRKLTEAFERLPGIGPKSAARLTFYLLHVPQSELDLFADSLTNLKKETVLCSICKNVAESDPCSICTDQNRDKSIICVVEQPLDVIALEKSGSFKGQYHVLHGSISPLNNIGPDELYVRDLLNRIRVNQDGQSEIREIILGMNPNMEGEATALYLKKELLAISEACVSNKSEACVGNINHQSLVISRLGQGLPTGADLEYADEVTLSRALEGRREY